jgi:hypothetical protein
MDMNEFQQQANRTDQRPGGDDESALLFPVIGLASETGSLVRHVKKRLRDHDAYELFSDNLAEKLGVGLDEIAQRNLRKIRGRWPVSGGTLPLMLLDDDFPEHERLPRNASVTFVESQEDDKTAVRLYDAAGNPLGDRLTDNAYTDDGYRFHDAFHLTYAALLGWSPITRYFFKARRASVPKVREVEDAGRARAIEEAVSAFVFDYAKDVRFLDGVDHVDFSLLATIRRLVRGFEVRERSAAEWEHSIMRGFAVWRPLYAARGGTLHLDLLARTIEFEAPA